MLLRYETEAATIYKRLKAIPRTGWVMHGIPEPETVYDHTVAAVRLADSLSPKLGLEDSQLDELKHMLEIHDWGEAIIGDIFIENEDSEKEATEADKKHALERQAMLDLTKDFAFQDTVMALWDRFEAGADQIAMLAKQIEQLQALDQAMTYEKKYQKDLFSEFYAYYKRAGSFTHPAILAHVEHLNERLSRQNRT